MTTLRFAAIATLTAARLLAEDVYPVQRIVVSIADRKLVLFEDDEPVKVYDVAVGKPSTPSPTGEFEVVTRLRNPTWFNHGNPIPPGKRNPLGTRWLGLSVTGYGIHGTNKPNSIGKAASKGCIRMRNSDVEELFTLVRVGARVELLAETPQWLAITTAAPAE